MAINYKLNGMGKLQKGLLERVSKDKIISVVKMHTTTMQKTAMSKASSTYTKGYSTGDTKKSIGISTENGGLTGVTGMGMEYNPYTEKGTRFMAAEPLLEPVFNEEKTKFKSDLEKLLK